MAAEAAAKLAPEEPILLCEKQNGIARVTLNRPKQYNALSEELLAELTATFKALAEDEALRAVVLGANGKAFCAGHDLKQMRATPDQDYYRRLFAACSEMMQSILRLPVPVIARVHGIATAAGCQLVATCDLAVAAETARFATSGINTGLFCSTPAVALTRNVAMKPAFEMLVTGNFVDAAEAQRLGLVNRVAPEAALDDAVEALARQIAAKSTVAVRTGKQMFYRQLEKGIGEAYRYAAEVMACNMMAEDVGEGIDAFIAKRKPVWRDR
jgi:enoyl-CoA hydratase/carnithine racemase